MNLLEEFKKKLPKQFTLKNLVEYEKISGRLGFSYQGTILYHGYNVVHLISTVSIKNFNSYQIVLYNNKRFIDNGSFYDRRIIICDNKDIKLYFPLPEQNNSVHDEGTYGVDEIIKRLNELCNPKKVDEESVNLILKWFTSGDESFSNEYGNYLGKIEELLTHEMIMKYMRYIPATGVYYFDDSIEEVDSAKGGKVPDGGNDEWIENKLIMIFIKKAEEEKYFRYTSLNTLFLTLNSLKYRMNGLAVMNDKDEINYADTYLDPSRRISPEKMHHSTIAAYNRRFISSFSDIELEDKLNMWFMYGDKGSGVCVEIKCIGQILNPFFMGSVDYADKEGKHSILDYFNSVQRNFRVNGKIFEFRKFYQWKHFFKPKEFTEERETRLLYVQPRNHIVTKAKWNLSGEYGIVHPFIEIDLRNKRIPFIVERIILGPKCPEKELNKAQIEEMLRSIRRDTSVLSDVFNNTKVEISKITNYR